MNRKFSVLPATEVAKYEKYLASIGYEIEELALDGTLDPVTKNRSAGTSF